MGMTTFSLLFRGAGRFAAFSSSSTSERSPAASRSPSCAIMAWFFLMRSRRSRSTALTMSVMRASFSAAAASPVVSMAPPARACGRGRAPLPALSAAGASSRPASMR